MQGGRKCCGLTGLFAGGLKKTELLWAVGEVKSDDEERETRRTAAHCVELSKLSTKDGVCFQDRLR